MRIVPFVLALAVSAGAAPAFAGAHSDYTKSFPLQTLKTFQFKEQHRISRDPLADNAIWANNIRSEIRNDLMGRGLEETGGRPDFYVAYYVGLRQQYDINSVPYGLPVFHRGFRTGWWGWPRGYDVWAVPYTESTLIVDVIDAHTNQLVWRGYDSDTLNMSKPEKTLDKAVDNVMSKFFHDLHERRG
jgi:uncharacterized protein DUF4136